LLGFTVGILPGCAHVLPNRASALSNASVRPHMRPFLQPSRALCARSGNGQRRPRWMPVLGECGDGVSKSRPPSRLEQTLQQQQQPLPVSCAGVGAVCDACVGSVVVQAKGRLFFSRTASSGLVVGKVATRLPRKNWREKEKGDHVIVSITWPRGATSERRIIRCIW